MRRTTAPVIPQKITRLRTSGATRDAANPTMMALSPASTTSMTMTLTRAMRFSSNQSIMTTWRALLAGIASAGAVALVSSPFGAYGGCGPGPTSGDPGGAAWLRPTAMRSTLGELEAAAGFHLAVFLPLDDPAVTREEATLLQHGTQLRFEIGERLGDAMAHGARLA